MAYGKRKPITRRKPTNIRTSRVVKSKRQVEPGTVVRVRDWPGVNRDRFFVTDIRDKAAGEYPKQVYALNIYKTPSGYELSGFRAFPFEFCEVDDKMTGALADHAARVKRRQGKRKAAAAKRAAGADDEVDEDE